MKTLIASLIALTLMLSVPLFAWAGSSSDSNTVRPNTPQAARMIATLERAEHLDRLNAASYTGEDSDEGVAYYQKAEQVHALLKKLQSGETVSEDDVRSALDNHDAVRFG